ncbi:MAG: hypothetical protein ABFD97_01685 [Syntrophobacter sp.]
MRRIVDRDHRPVWGLILFLMVMYMASTGARTGMSPGQPAELKAVEQSHPPSPDGWQARLTRRFPCIHGYRRIPDNPHHHAYQRGRNEPIAPLVERIP